MTNRTFEVGDSVNAYDLDLLPAGAQVERSETGWKVTSVPEVVSDPREDLAWELYHVFNPETTLTRLSHGWTADKWRELADYVSANFTRKQQLPQEVTDGDGDTWVLKSDGLYGVWWGSDRGSRTLEEIRERWGIRGEQTDELPSLWDNDGDEWKQVSPGRFTWVRMNGDLSESFEMNNRTIEQVRDQFGPARFNR